MTPASSLTPLVLKHLHQPARNAPVALLDRDGVLIRNRDDYVRDESEVEILETGVHGLRILAAARIRVVIVTNQACVGKGLVDRKRAHEIHDHVLAKLGDAARCIVATYLCPHRADEGCACRKPQPGMPLAALRYLGASAEDAFLVGDALTDIQAARAAGIRSYLVCTGRATLGEVTAARPVATVADSLVDSVKRELRALGTPVELGG